MAITEKVLWDKLKPDLNSGEDRINPNIAENGKERLDSISKILVCEPYI